MNFKENPNYIKKRNSSNRDSNEGLIDESPEFDEIENTNEDKIFKKEGLFKKKILDEKNKKENKKRENEDDNDDENRDKYGKDKKNKM